LFEFIKHRSHRRLFVADGEELFGRVSGSGHLKPL